MRWGCQRNNQRSPKTLLFVFRRFACRPAAFLSVWGGQPEREASLFNLKFLAARVRVYVRQLADGRVFAAVCGQPVFEVGVVGADEDGGIFLVKIDFGGLFLLGKSCSHRLILSAALSRNRLFFFSRCSQAWKIVIANQLIPQTVFLVKNVLVHIEILSYNIFAHTSQFPDCHTLSYPVVGFSCPCFCPYERSGQGETCVKPNKEIRRTHYEKSFVLKAFGGLY